MRAALLGLGMCVAASAGSSALSPERSWLCFFEADTAELTRSCSATAQAFASNWLLLQRMEASAQGERIAYPAGSSRVLVAGNTDAVEAAGPRATIGRARSEAVAEALVLGGVPRDVIVVCDFGASRMLVPTSEPELHNRFVYILRFNMPRVFC